MLTRRSLPIAFTGGSLLGSLLFVSPLLVSLLQACGPRLTHDAKPPAASDIPAANMVVKVDPSKLDATKKLAADGQFTVGGLFFKEGQSQDATVNVKLTQKDGATYRDYAIDLASVKGAAAKVDMWDDGTLTVIVPDQDAPVPGFETSNKNIKAVSVDFPGAAAPSTCYFGKAILDMSIRFALCDLGGSSPPTL